MTQCEESCILSNFIMRLRTCSALGCDSISHVSDVCETDAEVALCEENMESSNFEKVKRCALDTLSVIRDVVGPVEMQQNPGISPADVSACKILYPIARTALDCLITQIAPAIETARRYTATASDSATLTFEGLFLLVKTCLEMIHPVIYSAENVMFAQLITILDKSRPLRTLVKGCLNCIAVYLCRLYSFDITSLVLRNCDFFLKCHNKLFDIVLNFALDGQGPTGDAHAILFLKRVIGSIMRRLHFVSTADADNINEDQLVFLTKLVDCWYGTLVRSIIDLRGKLYAASGKPVKLAKLFPLICELPQLPAAHRLRLVIQIAFTLKLDAASTIQVEILNALTGLLDFSSNSSSEVLRSNLRPLSNSLLEVLLIQKLRGNPVGSNENTNCEPQVALVYCIAQCIRTSRKFRHEPDPESLDKFLQDQIRILLSGESGRENAVRLDRMVEETSSLPELDPQFPSTEEYILCRDDCVVLTKLTKLFNDLLNFQNERLEEAIAMVLCWLLREFDYELCLKLVAPICDEFLRTKRSMLIKNICNSRLNTSGIASAAALTKSRWVLGGRIFCTALEIFKQSSSSSEMEVDNERAPQQSLEILSSLFDSTLDVILENSGVVNPDLERCLGIYVEQFGLELYLRKVPLTKLYSIPITSADYASDAFVFMLPVLKRQLKGSKLCNFAKHFLPVALKIQHLAIKTRELCELGSKNVANVSKVSRDYDSILDQLNNVMVSMASGATDTQEALSRNNFAFLRYIIGMLEREDEKAISACRAIAAFDNLGDLGHQLIGICVKKFVMLDKAINERKMEVSPILLSLEDSLLAAIGNCGRFCPSEMLERNLDSFEQALQRSDTCKDSLVKISRALLPCVEDSLKLKMYRSWLISLSTSPSKSLYLALKTSCDTLRDFILKGSGLLGESDVFAKEICSKEGIEELASALRIMSEEQLNMEDEYCKHRLCCISAFVRLLEALKVTNVMWDESMKLYMDRLTKPLVFESLVNSSAPNNNTRASAAAIYDSLCNIHKDDLSLLLKLSVSGLACGGSSLMQIGVVKCLTRLMSVHSDQIMKYDFAQVLKFLFDLLMEDDINLYIQLLRFARVCIVKFTNCKVQWLAPLILKMFDNEKCCSRAKVFVKRVTAKLVSKLQLENLFKIFPKAHLSLLRNIVTTGKRKRRNLKLRTLLKSNSLHDSDDTDNEYEEFTQDTFKTNDQGKLILDLEKDTKIRREETTKMVPGQGKKQKKTERKASKTRTNTRPYMYIKLNTGNNASNRGKYKRETIKTLKSVMKGNRKKA